MAKKKKIVKTGASIISILLGGAVGIFEGVNEGSKKGGRKG